MKAIIRMDNRAVSPVIATILMVAITVVLAAVLYVMVSGLITSPGSTPKAIGVYISKSSDGTNHTLTFASVPTGLSTATTYVSIQTTGGLTAIGQTALSTYTATGTVVTLSSGGKVYIAYSNIKSGTVGAGDILRIGTTLAGTTTSTSGYKVTISTGSTILFTGTLL
jgi:flagellin-like protein